MLLRYNGNALITSAFVSRLLPSFLPSFIHSFIPSFIPSFLPPSLTFASRYFPHTTFNVTTGTTRFYVAWYVRTTFSPLCLYVTHSTLLFQGHYWYALRRSTDTCGVLPLFLFFCCPFCPPPMSFPGMLSCCLPPRCRVVFPPMVIGCFAGMELWVRPRAGYKQRRRFSSRSGP